MNPPSSTKSGQLYGNLKVAILRAGPSSNIRGGAERFYSGLSKGLSEIGCHVECVSVSADEHSFNDIVENYKHCAALDLSAYDVVISTKTPTYAVSHKCHVMYLVHTVRVFDDIKYPCHHHASSVE